MTTATSTKPRPRRNVSLSRARAHGEVAVRPAGTTADTSIEVVDVDDLAPTSLLASLDDLQAVQQQRLADEEAAQHAALQAEEARKLAERQARELADEERLAQVLADHREEKVRDRIASARISAARDAVLIRQQQETEHQCSMEARSLENEHDRQLLRLRQDRSKRHLRGLLAAAVIALGFGAFTTVSQLSEVERDKATLAENLTVEIAEARDAAAAEVARLESELDHAGYTAAAEKKLLETEIYQARQELAAAEAAVAENTRRPAQPRKRLANTASSSSTKTSTSDTKVATEDSWMTPEVCLPGDPMCGTL